MKALDYLHHSALNAEALSNPRLISTANIIQNFPNPKVSTRNSLITPEMDASYLDAVDRGDMATAQKMVMEHAGYIKRLCDKARESYSITSSIVVAATKEDYAKPLRRLDIAVEIAK